VVRVIYDRVNGYECELMNASRVNECRDGLKESVGLMEAQSRISQTRRPRLAVASIARDVVVELTPPREVNAR